MPDPSQRAAEATELNKAGEHAKAWDLLSPLLEYPGTELDAAAWRAVLAALAQVGRKWERRAWWEPMDKLARDPHDVKLLFKTGYELLEDGRPEVAACLFLYAHRLKPTNEDILTELSCSLEDLRRHDEARGFLLAADPVLLRESFNLRYLLAFNHLMCRDVDAARALVPNLLREKDPEMLPLAHELDHMLARYDVARTATPLDGTDLRGWHFVVNGGFLVDTSGPLGGRHGQPADSAAHRRLGVDGALAALDALGVTPSTVYSLALPGSATLAAALAERLSRPVVEYPARGSLEPGLLVLFSTSAVDDAWLEVLQWQRPGQPVFAWNASWREEPAFSADILGRLQDGPGAPDQTITAKSILDAPATPTAVLEPLRKLALAVKDMRRDAGPALYLDRGQRRRHRPDSPVPLR
ncbi:MAG: hypothetical protein HY904_12365 [Deltaproteobacteria bacterium]|nr:hypothetical protein [Deltaproteobacteria bacterium]